MNKERSLLLQSQWYWTWVVNEFVYYLEETKLVVFGYC